jgi:hypothetical protein
MYEAEVNRAKVDALRELTALLKELRQLTEAVRAAYERELRARQGKSA